ncbi:hypothetical protein WN943_011262 [Citrus x changshan-huyou]
MHNKEAPSYKKRKKVNYIRCLCPLTLLVLPLAFGCSRKVLASHSYFLVLKMCPSITPIIVPLAYPIATVFQPNANTDSECGSSPGGAASEFSHFFDKGPSHNPGFPSNELFPNVSNCFPRGIGPVSR